MNSTVLITGASSGIGFELSKIFARNGYNLVLVARNEQKLQECSDYLKTNIRDINVHIIPSDLSKLEHAQAIYQHLQDEKIDIDILVNNAGNSLYGMFHENNPLSDEIDIINLNITSLTYLTGLFMKDMVKRGRGRILNVASLAAFQPIPNMAVYAASKAYVLSFTEAIANELKGTGVYASVLCPGFTKTALTEKLASTSGAKVFRDHMMSAEYVAAEGYKGLMNGKTVIIPGTLNNFLQIFGKFAPRKLITAFSRMLVERK